MSELPKLQSLINYSFKDLSLLTLSMTHSSSVNTPGIRAGSDNERLEFLGDAVVDLSVAMILLEKFPESTEGELTKRRAELVCKNTLAIIAKELELENFIIAGRSVTIHETILADALEALIGAVFQDGGFDVAFMLIQRLWSKSVEEAIVVREPKNQLQEIMHQLRRPPIQYKTERYGGTEHRPEFKSVVWSLGKPLGMGVGTSKKIAETTAASDALETLKK